MRAARTEGVGRAAPCRKSPRTESVPAVSEPAVLPPAKIASPCTVIEPGALVMTSWPVPIVESPPPTVAAKVPTSSEPPEIERSPASASGPLSVCAPLCT